MERLSPPIRVLVRREDHGASSNVAVVDDVIEDVGGIVAVGEITDLVDNEHVGAYVFREGLAQLALAARGGQVVDQLGGGGEENIEPVLHGAVRDRDRKVRLAAPGLAKKDCGTSFGDKVRSE